MKFSVLMSVYYKERPEYFDLALNSILTVQTLSPDEFILICDGPLNDELNEIISNYEVEYPNILRTYRLEKNVGLGNALNFGLKKCQNEFVARADSDDICSPNRFERQMAYLSEHPDVVVLGSDIDEFDEDWSEPNSIKSMPPEHYDICKMATMRNPINHMTAIFKKSIIEEVGSYQHLAFLEDYYLWVRVIAAGGHLANIRECLVHARVGNGMVQRRGNIQYLESWRNLDRFMKENGMINNLQHFRNMIALRTFLYIPTSLRNVVYTRILRKGKYNKTRHENCL